MEMEGEVNQNPPKYVKVLVTGLQAGEIIGNKGATIGNIRSASGCVLRLSDKSAVFPGSQEQVLMIAGQSDEGLKTALHEVATLCAPAEGNHSQLAVTIPSSAASTIIGKGGEGAKRLREKTGCNVSVKPPPNPPCGEQAVLITAYDPGSQTSVAAFEVMEIASQCEDYSRFHNVNYAPSFGGGKDNGKGFDKGFGGKGKGFDKGQGKGFDKGQSKGFPGPDAGYGAARQPQGPPRSGPYGAGPPAGPPNVSAEVNSLEVAISFLIPTASIGAVLGKGGSILAEIRKSNHCAATIATDRPEGEDPTMTVRGRLSNCHSVMNQIFERVLADQAKQGQGNGAGY